MINFMLLISRQGKVRLTKWYNTYTPKDKAQFIREVSGVVLSRPFKGTNVIEWRDEKVVYKRYASLYFICSIDLTHNELEALETIHLYVESLDRYFGNVCELDLIFNFHKAYYILDEIIIGGQLQETCKRDVLRFVGAQDALMEDNDVGVQTK